MKAVIPAAGFGTRFLPLTKAQPKEMLPVVNKPTIQWVVEEAVDAGITDIAIITGKHKQAIENHFRPMDKLEQALEKAGKIKELGEIKTINNLYEKGFYIKIFTARYMGRNKENRKKVLKKKYETKNFLKRWGLKFNELIMCKPSYDVFVDDKAFGFSNKWKKFFKKL